MALLHLAPIHPGEILREDFMKPLGLSCARLANAIGIPVKRMAEIIHGKRPVTSASASRLASYFKTTRRFWLNLQMRYDLDTADKRCLP